MVVWWRRTNQVCYYWFSDIFHVLCHGFCCIFSVYMINVAEKNFHDVNSNFLVPSYSFLQCRVIQQDLIWSIDFWHMVVVEVNNVWLFGFLLDLPCLLNESNIFGEWALLMTRTSLLSFHLMTEMSPRYMKTISTFWNFFPANCDGFHVESVCKLPVT